MSCEGCWQKQRAINESQIKILKTAKEIANRTGEWQGIYYDQSGEWYIVPASSAGQYPNISQWATPD